MKSLKVPKLCLALVVCCAFVSVSVADDWKDESGKGKKPKVQHQYDGKKRSYHKQHGHNRFDIPKGHYPPPGECRIWYPDRPAGHQPPPGNCSRLRGEVPPGAWLIEHPADDQKHFLLSLARLS